MVLPRCYDVGEPDGSWAVDVPAEEVPAELPEPCLGINFARNGGLLSHNETFTPQA